MKSRRRSRPPTLAPTMAYPAADSPAPLSKPRCRFARTYDEATDSRSDLRRLLHTRLRLAALITTAPFLFFLAKNFFEPVLCDPSSPNFLIQAGVTALALFLTGYVWLRRACDWGELRTVEVVLFGTVAGYFFWLEYQTLVLPPSCGTVPEEMEWQVFHWLIMANSFRWFFLIVVYGVFIPNTWRRCAYWSGLTAATAAGARLALRLSRGTASKPDLLYVLCDMAVAAGRRPWPWPCSARTASRSCRTRPTRPSSSASTGSRRSSAPAAWARSTWPSTLLLRRPCAVKLIRPDQAGDPTNLQRFEREVRAMATLTHWNTVEIFDYGHAEDGTFYYVMEYLPGQNLETLVDALRAAAGGAGDPLPAAGVPGAARGARRRPDAPRHQAEQHHRLRARRRLRRGQAARLRPGASDRPGPGRRTS